MAISNITKPYEPATQWRIGNILLSVGVALMIWFVTSLLQQWEFARTASHATGIVKELNPPVITFQSRVGETITFTQNLRSSKSPAKVGELVHVAYLPSNPSRAEMVEFIWSGTTILFVASMLLMVLGYLVRRGVVVVGPLRQTRITGEAASE